jgi:hypothetical protein
MSRFTTIYVSKPSKTQMETPKSQEEINLDMEE